MDIKFTYKGIKFKIQNLLLVESSTGVPLIGVTNNTTIKEIQDFIELYLNSPSREHQNGM